MSELVSKLPDVLVTQISNYLWGSKEIYQKRLTKITKNIPTYPLLSLKAIKDCHYKNRVWIDLEDNLYCHGCGEKSLDFAYVCLGRNRCCDYCQDN